MGDVGPGKIPHGGTYAGNVVAMAAANAVLDVIEEGALARVFAHGERLMAGWKEILGRSGIPHVVQGPAAMPGIVFTEETVCTEYRHWAEGDHDLYEEIIQRLFERGVMPDKDSREPWFISAAHSDADADVALQALEESIREVKG